MNKETIDFVKQWLLKANEDLLVVDKLTEFDVVATSSVCFHCQQAVEKSLKAFLIANGKEIKRTHNIEYLLTECSDLDTDFAEIDPLELSDFGVEALYPGDLYLPDNDEVIIYKELAGRVTQMVESKLRSLL